ncbi:MAG: zinc metallopeptidase [Thermomicrobiales bacterium]|nr:zinc metallopeptidase [Thermomicrobiales bacterium]
MIFDPMYLIFMLPGFILALWAQSKVKGTYEKYSKVPNTAGMTGAQAARRILDEQGLQSVPIEVTKGVLSDHYDPRSRKLVLSEGVYSGRSISAIAVAAHEAGHAIQHKEAYAPLKARTAIVPAVSIGSNLGFIILIAGVMLGSMTIGWVGVALFALATVFALITLPVEFNASSRARLALVQAASDDVGVAGARKARASRRCSTLPPGPMWPGS